MPDAELKLRISVDDANTIPAATKQAAAAVQQDTEKISRSFQDAGAKARGAGSEMSYSMTEARHAVQGLGEEVGIHLPRFVTSFLTEVPAVGAAMSAAFSTIAVVGLIQVIGQIPEVLGNAVAALEGWDAEAKKAFGDEIEAASRMESEMRKLAEARLNASTIGLEHQQKYNQELRISNDLAKDAQHRNAEYTQQINELNIHLEEIKHAYGSGGLLTGIFNKKEIEQTEAKLAQLKADQKEAEAAALSEAGRNAAITKERQDDARRLQIELQRATIDDAAKIEEAKNAIAEQVIRDRSGMMRLGIQEEARQLLALEDQRFASEKKTLDQKIELMKRDPSQTPAGMKRLTDEQETLELQHQQRMQTIKNSAATQEKTRRDRSVTEERKYQLEMASIAEEAAQQNMEQTSQMNDARLKAGDIGLNKWKAQEKAALDEWHRGEAEALQRQYELEGDDLAAREKTAEKRLQIEKEYQLKVKAVEAEGYVHAKQVFDLIDKNFGSHIEAWISGQEKLKAAMEQAWNGIAQTAISNMIRMGEQSLIQLALGKSVAAKEIFIEAKTTAAHAYKATMKALPFPADVIVAPIVAGAAFAGVMALASFDRGGIMDEDGMAMVHKKEMVLDPVLSSGLQNMILAGGGNRGGGDVHVHYNAHGAGSVADHKTNAREIVKIIKREQRRGAIPSR